MPRRRTFQRRGIVEGFFGPPWGMKHRARIFEFGARRGMNTYLYAPKDDPYHRKRWREPYPDKEWKELLKLIRAAQKRKIDFVYGFHPGKGLCFSAKEPVTILLSKAQRFYEVGVRTFAVLFDDIPSRLEHREDQAEFDGSLAKAEAVWLQKILEQQPGAWQNVEWWICPSYYTEDPLLARMFGKFESGFIETLSANLPESVACFWTGPKVVPKKISLKDIRGVAKRLERRLILWDNYPVNDLSMSKDLHLDPLIGRDARLAEAAYGYLNNPLLQEALSFLPLATCFDYATNPSGYDPEKSWRRAVAELFGKKAMEHWLAIRKFCQRVDRAKSKDLPLTLSTQERSVLGGARAYILRNRNKPWAKEFRPWLALMEKVLTRKID